MNNQQQPKLYPAWRQALSELLLADLQPGTVIEKTWLEEKFDIKPPTTIAEAEKNQSVFRFFIWKLREELLIDTEEPRSLLIRHSSLCLCLLVSAALGLLRH